jgi:hypothetical protein
MQSNTHLLVFVKESYGIENYSIMDLSNQVLDQLSAEKNCMVAHQPIW